MSIQSRMAWNRAFPCRIPGCNTPRTSVSPYCGKHRNCVTRWGHPLGRKLDPKKDYGHERQLVERLLAEHPQHPGVLAALAWLERWLQSAGRGEAVPAAKQLQRLAEAGVTARQMLIEAAALFLLSRWAPRTLPDDDRLTFQIGHRVLSLAPRERRFGRLNGKPRYFFRAIGKTDRRAVGGRIRANLTPLFLGMQEALERKREQEQAAARALHTPFPINPTAAEGNSNA